MKLITDNEMLMRYMPHSIKPVAGELSLFEKIEVYLVSAEHWVEKNFTGEVLLSDISLLEGKLVEALRQIVVAEALIRAIPSLDLILTPNGFGVVNTATIGAASAPRIERLLDSMCMVKDDAIAAALTLLPQYDDWVASRPAQFFGQTLFPNIDLCDLCGHNSGRWEKYVELRGKAIEVEQTLAEDYFSPELMEELRRKNLLGELTVEQGRIVELVRSQIVDVLQGKPINGNRMRNLVNFIRYRPDAFPLWHNSRTAKMFSPPKFENEKKSSGYWF